MTDERFVFQQDIKERSKMKTGAYHKKNGSKSKKCTLPSDHLTAREKKKLNGECMSIKMNEPYHNWKEFKKLSVEMQRNYISGLVVDHQARSKDIAEMFNISPNSFSAFCSKFNPHIKFNGGRVMDEKWLDFITKPAAVVRKMTQDEIIQTLAGADIIEKKEEPVAEEPIANDIPEPVEVVEEKAIEVESKKVSGYGAMVKMNLDLKGTKEEIMQMIDAILGSECSYIMALKITNLAHAGEEGGAA